MAEADSSLEIILRNYSALAQRLAASHEANPDLARDLAQEILVAVWRAWPAFRQQCSERTYVARIAHNRIATHISRARVASLGQRPHRVQLTRTSRDTWR